jgi:hypothetical protein
MTAETAALALPPAGVPPSTLPALSRRSFLKMLGVSMALVATPEMLAGLALGAVPNTAPAAAVTSTLPIPAATLLLRALDELRVQGFAFALDQGGVVALPGRPELRGLLLRDTLAPPSLAGADIALTLDYDAPERSALCYTVGRSGEAGLELLTVVLSAKGRREARHLYQRPDCAATLVPARYPLRHTGYTVEQISEPDCAGGAPTFVERTGWWYTHADEVRWLEVEGPGGQRVPLLRHTSAAEYRDVRHTASPYRRHAAGWQSEMHRVSVAAGQLG